MEVAKMIWALGLFLGELWAIRAYKLYTPEKTIQAIKRVWEEGGILEFPPFPREDDEIEYIDFFTPALEVSRPKYWAGKGYVADLWTATALGTWSGVIINLHAPKLGVGAVLEIPKVGEVVSSRYIAQPGDPWATYVAQEARKELEGIASYLGSIGVPQEMRYLIGALDQIATELPVVK